MISSYLGKMLWCHLRQNSIKVLLISFVDKAVMEHSLAFMAEQPKNLIVLTNHPSICLKYTWENPVFQYTHVYTPKSNSKECFFYLEYISRGLWGWIDSVTLLVLEVSLYSFDHKSPHYGKWNTSIIIKEYFYLKKMPPILLPALISNIETFLQCNDLNTEMIIMATLIALVKSFNGEIAIYTCKWQDLCRGCCYKCIMYRKIQGWMYSLGIHCRCSTSKVWDIMISKLILKNTATCRLFYTGSLPSRR